MDRRIQVVELQRNWTPPDKLDRSRPRPVSLTGGGKALLSLAVALFVGGLLAGIALGVTAGRQAEEQRLLREHGADTDGLVTRLWRGQGEARQPWVAYRFTVHGRTYARRAKASLRVFRNLRVGSHLAVRYFRGNPDLNYPRGSEKKPMPMWIPYVVAAALAAFGWLATLPILSQRRLLARGRPARGLVTHHTQTEHGKTIHYEFALLSGALAKGKSGPSKNPPALGGTICVLYDPENPRKNAPYPLSLARPACLRKTPTASRSSPSKSTSSA